MTRRENEIVVGFVEAIVACTLLDLAVWTAGHLGKHHGHHHALHVTLGFVAAELIIAAAVLLLSAATYLFDF